MNNRPKMADFPFWKMVDFLRSKVGIKAICLRIEASIFGKIDRFWAKNRQGRLVMESQPNQRSSEPPKTTDECHMAWSRTQESTKELPTFGGGSSWGTFWRLASGVK